MAAIEKETLGTTVSAPLQGIKVLDLSRVLAGPFCAQLLGDLGADVVKVEVPGTGDDARQLGSAVVSPSTPEGAGRQSNFFLACNRNKRSVAVDLATPEGRELVMALLQKADVVVENFKAGGMLRLGLDPQAIHAANPRLIHCSITGFGHTGPYAARPAYDFIMQAMTGMMSTCGVPEQSPGAGPMRTAIPTTDLVAGYQACVAILGALIQRSISGKGQFIDAAMLDASVAFNVHLAQGFLMGMGVPQRQGNNNPIAAPSGVYASADGWLVVAAGNDRQFEHLCSALQLGPLREQERFASNAARVANRQALHTVMEPVLRSRTSAQWLAQLEAAGVPCAAIHDMQAVFDDPQVQHRQMVVHSQRADGSTVPLLRSALNMQDHAVRYSAPPLLGEHTEEVLVQWLQMPSEAIAHLAHCKAIATLADAGARPLSCGQD
ncbi:CoA transferase [Lampropedia puyangensis]|uniref:CoA transferase n=1 Tax=Lampropedia puyangensis TaxID=1330072 RepID=A0A4S8FCI8_9BURK|nr:CoA transferase [Lampropedia puyangensis]THU05039.1 CoA transferase [Lampropedia puyangensis]